MLEVFQKEMNNARLCVIYMYDSNCRNELLINITRIRIFKILSDRSADILKILTEDLSHYKAAILVKVMVRQPVKKFSALYKTRTMTTQFTRALHWSLS